MSKVLRDTGIWRYLAGVEEKLMNPAFCTCLRVLIPSMVAVIVSIRLAGASPGREQFGGVTNGVTTGESRFENVRIDSIVVDNRNVFDTRDPRYNRFPYKTADKFHFVTRKAVIARELLFAVGDPFRRDLAEETARNLRTRLVLYDAWVETSTLPDSRLLVRVVTIDQWSLILSGSLAREGNRTDIRFGLQERNLLGSNQLLSWEYFIPEKERNYINIAYGNPRFWGKPVSVNGAYNSDPKNDYKQVSVGHPYYDLRQALSWSAAWQGTSARIDDSVRNRKRYSTSDQVEVGLGGRLGTYHDKIILEGSYTYRTSKTRTVAFTHPDSVIAPPIDSTYHLLMGFTGIQRIYYVGLKRINGFNYTEDFSTGLDATIGIGRAFSRDWNDYLFDQVAVNIASVWCVGKEVFMFSYQRLAWFPIDGPVMQSADMSLRFYQTSLTYATFAFHIKYQSEERDLTIYLGGDSGIRGYDEHYRGGDRLFLTNTEVRVFPGIEILSVRFGGALFVDAGRTYQPGAKFSLKDLVVSAGAGLRISFERTARSELARIDLAHTRVPRDGRLKSVWQLSIGHGQYF
ncbi:hypothetical protein C3F09_00375 [candidate division GN15 bacterium]|uniref:Bacterial surface antigen (D15) domain-containing protein n=1 Tax=candidate division GN15 bacterium TaxID=2072418 RepID=A0A855X4T6_9BACT|nr:MAG: hypothetical protein C3F09_00375 [candidate division GN15 bacterium]